MSVGISSHNSKGRETRKPFDTTHHKVHEIPFNCKIGNYHTDLDDELRKLLSTYNPRTSKEWEAVTFFSNMEWEAVVRVLLYPTRSQDEDSKLDVYIDCSDVYSIGVGFRDFLFEYGKYPEEEQEERSEQTKSEKKNKKLTRMDKKIIKPGKQKKKTPSNRVKKRLLLGSHLLRFNEGYGDGLYPPCDVNIGKNNLSNQ
uniref:Uncharacterized protein n=1 Tax=Tanacetum cinerariifolium TaxID=118510 RepID=A0A6L2MEI9_TANCI|nr:hypothetical protein [Tanacetum cinerariifolium]